jgi:hypothetical protein
MSQYFPRLVALEGKHPSEIVDYSIDLTPWLPAGDTVSTITGVTATAGLTIASSPAPAVASGILTFWVTGGVNGTTYFIQVVFVTVGGRTLVVDLQLTVTDPTP